MRQFGIRDFLFESCQLTSCLRYIVLTRRWLTTFKDIVSYSKPAQLKSLKAYTQDTLEPAHFVLGKLQK